MIPGDIITDQVRPNLNDSTATFRWANSLLYEILVDGIRDIWTRRPDARFDSSGDLQALSIDSIAGETLPTDPIILGDEWRKALVHYVTGHALGMHGEDQEDKANGAEHIAAYEREMQI
jgi:hypothetical protein